MGHIENMIPPSQRRPSIWREGVLQIWVTRACDKACFACTQGSNLGGKPGMISLEHFEAACKSLDGYFGVVGIFGGNPVLHPKFEELMEIYRHYVPFEQRGVWCNHPKGKGGILRKTFNPTISNLNVHLDQEAHDEFLASWPESAPYLKGVDSDSRHSSPFVALKDVIEDEEERWKLISDCDINKYWSAMVCVVRGELRGFFCEIAGAQAMLHENDPSYPDLGIPAIPGWWNQGIEAFEEQVKFYCHRCGIPLRAKGELAIGGKTEYASETHIKFYSPKIKGRPVYKVENLTEQPMEISVRATEYIFKAKLN
jgi:hypothetical protein